MDRLESLKGENLQSNIDHNYNSFFDQEIDRSFSLPSLSSQVNQDDENRSNTIEQMKLLELAEKMEKTALEIRVYCRKKWNASNVNYSREKKKIPRFVSENIFSITLLWQLLCVAALEIVDVVEKHFNAHERHIYFIGITIMVIFQLSNLVLSLIVTVKLGKQYMHQTASMKFLLQSYAATVLLFAGMYTFVARILPTAFKGLRGNIKEKMFALKIFSQLLFTSISTGTLCGSSNITALHVVTEMLMSFQMLLSFVYFASILSQVVSPLQSLTPKDVCNELLKRNESLVRNIQNDYHPLPSRRRSCETI